MTRIEEIKQRLEAATGPFTTYHERVPHHRGVGGYPIFGRATTGGDIITCPRVAEVEVVKQLGMSDSRVDEVDKANADFFAHAYSDIHYLLNQIEVAKQ